VRGRPFAPLAAATLLVACSGGLSQALGTEAATVSAPGPAETDPPLPDLPVATALPASGSTGTDAPLPDLPVAAAAPATPEPAPEPVLAPPGASLDAVPPIAVTTLLPVAERVFPTHDIASADAVVSALGFASGRALVPGDTGTDVAWLQHRLASWHFAPGAEDGVLGESTLAALWAMEKLAGLEPRDEVDAEVWHLLSTGVEIPALVATGEPTRVEVDLDRQVMTIWRDGQVELVTHVSTGSGEHYCNGGRCRNAVTPTGDYRINRSRQGWWHGPLGALYNPMYFNGGIAIHGSNFVPTWPDSHGCVRVPMNVADQVPLLLEHGYPVHVLRSSELAA
jgi:hypothetical protein